MVMEIPIPKPTNYPGTVFTYIDKVFNVSIGTDLIQVGENNINQISGCRFTNINNTRRNYYIRIVNEAIIFDNIFENTEFITEPEKSGIIWNNYEGNLTISNCTFIRISGKGGEGYVYTSNNYCNAHVIMDRCDFIDCGKVGDLQLISVLRRQSSIKFYDCKFSFSTSSRICGVLDMRTNDCLFDHCQFIGCASDTILLSNKAESDEQPIGTFEFTNNYVKNNHGKFIKAFRILTKPIIDNNIFESTTLNEGYYIELPNNQSLIEMNNNTFTRITSSGTQDKSSGGIGLFIESTTSEFKIKYHECKFYDNTNNQATYPNCQGGAIQYGFSDTSNLNCHLEITKCEFRFNKVQRHGGAISIRTTKSILIQDCIFESNIANNDNNNSELLFTNYYDLKSKGFGGSIYINPSFSINSQDYQMSSISISNCVFNNNSASQGDAIYIDGEDCDTTITISNNKFYNNTGDEDSLINGSVISSELLTINKLIVLATNDFYNTDDENIESFSYVNHSGFQIYVYLSPFFSASNQFTKTSAFSETLIFSKSSKFSDSQHFSDSLPFLPSSFFSSSDEFSKSQHFSKTSEFSMTSHFSISNEFSNSQHFSKTSEFSMTSHFSISNEFSNSQYFSKTSPFSFSNEFSSSKIYQNITNSSPFVKTSLFSSSDKFSDSQHFTNTSPFQKTSLFSSSDVFTFSDKFTPSSSFTDSNTFNPSSIFTASNKFPTTFVSQKNIITTFSKSFSLTYVNKKSVSLSVSYVISNTYEMSFDEQINTYMMVITQRNYQTYLPYIIYYLSPIYVEQTFLLNLIKKKTISPEQLIGVSCGSASVFFLVLGIVICFIKKKYENKAQFDEFDDISGSSSEIEFNQRFNETQILNINENQETEEDISIKEINEAFL